VAQQFVQEFVAGANLDWSMVNEKRECLGILVLPWMRYLAIL
jgi:hypothetical protein